MALLQQSRHHWRKKNLLRLQKGHNSLFSYWKCSGQLLYSVVQKAKWNTFFKVLWGSDIELRERRGWGYPDPHSFHPSLKKDITNVFSSPKQLLYVAIVPFHFKHINDTRPKIKLTLRNTRYAQCLVCYWGRINSLGLIKKGLFQLSSIFYLVILTYKSTRSSQ